MSEAQDYDLLAKREKSKRAFRTIVRIRARRELIGQGYNFREANRMVQDCPDDLIDDVAKAAGNDGSEYKTSDLTDRPFLAFLMELLKQLLPLLIGLFGEPNQTGLAAATSRD